MDSYSRKPEEHALHEAILTALRHFEDAMQSDADILKQLRNSFLTESASRRD